MTSYCEKRLKQRNLTTKEALHVLSHRHASYPIDADGRQKIRSAIGSHKKAFLTVMEDNKKVVIITGGES